jgi:hypothetical protein
MRSKFAASASMIQICFFFIKIIIGYQKTKNFMMISSSLKWAQNWSWKKGSLKIFVGTFFGPKSTNFE